MSYENDNIENSKVENILKRHKRQINEYGENDIGHINVLGNKKCFGQFCLPKGYDNLVPPSKYYGDNYTEKIVDVNMDFDVRVFEVNDIKFTVSLTMYFGIRWQEPRLLKRNHSKSFEGTFERVHLHMLQDLWLPNIYILNLKSYKNMNIFSDFAGKCFGIIFLISIIFNSFEKVKLTYFPGFINDQ